MAEFHRHTGIAAPFLRPNVDTDVIMPLNRQGRAANLSQAEICFESIRYNSDGSENPEFILNQEPYRNASVLLAGENFGTGSSRESAVTGLMAFGFRSVIAPSFGQIFYNNCFANGMLPVVIDFDLIQLLSNSVRSNPQLPVTVDLESLIVTRAGMEPVGFEVDSRLREKLLNDLSDLDEILAHEQAITDFQEADTKLRPWAYR